MRTMTAALVLGAAALGCVGCASTRDGSTSASLRRADVASMGLTRWTAIDDLIVLLGSNGIPVADVTPTLSPTHVVLMWESALLCGASNAAILAAAEGDRIVALRFQDPDVLATFIATRTDAAVHGEMVVLPEQCSTPMWERIAETLQQNGGQVVDSFQVRAALTDWTCTILSRAIINYQTETGTLPDFENNPWQQLRDQGLTIPQPENILSSAPDRSSVMTVSISGVGGESIMATEAGWVWNSIDQRLTAAGYHPALLAGARYEYEIAADRLEAVSVEAAIRGTQSMRQMVLDGQLRRFQAAIDEWSFDRESSSEPAFPSIDDLRNPGTVLTQIPVNPYTGSADVVSGSWSTGATTTGEISGWCYDETCGRVWSPESGIMAVSAEE